MKLGYFPGCSLKGSSLEFDESLQAIAKKIDMELVEVPDWNCCGSSSAHILNHELSLALPGRVLALAEQAGLDTVMSPCAACHARLFSAQHELSNNEEMRKRVSEMIEMNLKCTTKLVNVIEGLFPYFDKIIDESKIVKPFNHKVACYYGCLLIKPQKLFKFDRVEDPQSMDNLMRKIGAEPVDWSFKTECCGAGFSVTRTDIVAKLCGQIIEDATRHGAEAIIVACPMCQSNLDLRRPEIQQVMKKKYDIPVLFITQAIGLALGLSNTDLGLQRHMVEVKFNDKSPALTAAVTK